ncbi:hypothetical protein E1264_17880 [Actinomadura sp. KC216]|uniref:hypothetical protein n=1 Tax=Actinomadura sp. KC216 TaxID=2530370 RepID=UPI001042A751|nr:hypothetical protein [Actinomadura sp. KC216]TDB86468.1 hypothetical protein E1264_17880 [Actinomadura sp. KC216]
MSLPTYEQAWESARDERPFSNGTEGYAWLDNWCGRCINDKPARDGRDDEGCPLILVSLMGRTPIEWIEKRDPESGLVRLGDSYHCMYFRDEDDGGDPEPTPIPDPPGQLTLTPREPHERARMLTSYPEPVKAGGGS